MDYGQLVFDFKGSWCPRQMSSGIIHIILQRIFVSLISIYQMSSDILHYNSLMSFCFFNIYLHFELLNFIWIF